MASPKPHIFSLLFWIKQLYPIVFFSAFVYSAILALYLCGIYQLKRDNPIIILGYISLIHAFAYPIFHLGMSGSSICLLIFPYINLIWIVAVVICHFVIKFFIADTIIQLEKTPIHYHFLVAYFSAAVILEVLLMIFKTQEMKKVEIAIETQESDEKTNNTDKATKQKKKDEQDFCKITLEVAMPNNPFEEEPVKKPKNTNGYQNAKENAKENATENDRTLKKISLPKIVKIDRNSSNYTSYKSNKEQVNEIIETQNNIRKLLNAKKNYEQS